MLITCGLLRRLNIGAGTRAKREIFPILCVRLSGLMLESKDVFLSEATAAKRTRVTLPGIHIPKICLELTVPGLFRRTTCRL